MERLTTTDRPKRILRLPEVLRKTGLGRSAVYDRLDKKSPRHDPEFPVPFVIGGGRSVGWLESEVDAWIDRLAQTRRTRA